MDTLRRVSWEAIREEKFHLTPAGCFENLVKNVREQLRDEVEEEDRRSLGRDRMFGGMGFLVRSTTHYAITNTIASHRISPLRGIPFL